MNHNKKLGFADKHRFGTALQYFFVLVLASASFRAMAYEDHVDFEAYSVYFNVFNSTFIQPDLAANYGIKRSKYESLLNVSISKKGQHGGIAAKIYGTVSNLLQQQKNLNFIEISEDTATYYIAPIRISGEESVRIHLVVRPEGAEQDLELTFNKKVYSDP